MERMTKNPKFKNKVCNACSGRDTFNVVVRDTLIETETDTAWQTIELGCDSLGQVFIKEIQTRDGRILKLKSELEKSRLTIRGTKEKEYILVPRVSTKEYRSQVIETEVPYIPWWAKVLFFFSAIGIIWTLVRLTKLIIQIASTASGNPLPAVGGFMSIVGKLFGK